MIAINDLIVGVVVSFDEPGVMEKFMVISIYRSAGGRRRKPMYQLSTVGDEEDYFWETEYSLQARYSLVESSL